MGNLGERGCRSSRLSVLQKVKSSPPQELHWLRFGRVGLKNLAKNRVRKSGKEIVDGTMGIVLDTMVRAKADSRLHFLYSSHKLTPSAAKQPGKIVFLFNGLFLPTAIYFCPFQKPC